MKMMTAMYTLRRGGAYDRFQMMIDAFLERECQVHCLSLIPIDIKHSFFHNHVIYFPFKKTDGLMAKLVVLFTFPLRSIWIAWSSQIDLIIAFGSLYAFLLGFSKWSLRKPMVTLIRGNPHFGLTAQNSWKSFLNLNKLVERLGLLFCDRIITNNHAIQEEILKGLGERTKIAVRVLYNNIPPMNIPVGEDIRQKRAKYGIPEDGKVLITAGILNRGKNIDVLIRSLSKIDVQNLFLIVAGDGSTEADLEYKGFLQALARKLEVGKRVVFTGWLDKEELWETYLASDLFVLPSLSEGMPNAMLEALGAGLLCLGSDIAGIRDILQYEELLFDPRDEIGLRDRIRRVFSDRAFFNEMKRLSEERKQAFHFDWKEKLFQMVTVGMDARKA